MKSERTDYIISRIRNGISEGGLSDSITCKRDTGGVCLLLAQLSCISSALQKPSVLQEVC